MSEEEREVWEREVSKVVLRLVREIATLRGLDLRGPGGADLDPIMEVAGE